MINLTALVILVTLVTLWHTGAPARVPQQWSLCTNAYFCQEWLRWVIRAHRVSVVWRNIRVDRIIRSIIDYFACTKAHLAFFPSKCLDTGTGKLWHLQQAQAWYEAMNEDEGEGEEEGSAKKTTKKRTLKNEEVMLIDDSRFNVRHARQHAYQTVYVTNATGFAYSDMQRGWSHDWWWERERERESKREGWRKRGKENIGSEARKGRCCALIIFCFVGECPSVFDDSRRFSFTPYSY